MYFFSHKRIRTIILFLLSIFGIGLAPFTVAAESRGTLLNIVTSCIDINTPDYCKHCLVPRVESACAKGRDCKETTEVWEETTEYIVIRDRKMCGCPRDFVHGIVIPRAPISGIEDARRPDSIWSVAWVAAHKRIKKESDIALVVNPAALRSQDQLHVHLVRMLPTSRLRFGRSRTVRVKSLEDVWKAAKKTATAINLADYGVLVAMHREGGFLVVVEERSPEKLFTQWECR